jgi:hypothetical protein
MKNTKCLIITYGFFGDIAFASSIAKKLKDETQFEIVDYLIGFPQMQRLLQNNPFINDVYVSDFPAAKPVNNSINYSSYDKIIELPELSFIEPPPYEFQKFAGIKNPSTEYQIYTEPEYDNVAKELLEKLNSNGKKTLGFLSNWESKSYIFTEQEYIKGVDVPNLGYGGKHRNINKILTELSEHFNLIEIGLPPNITQNQSAILDDSDQKSILFECSLLKYCDAFIGTEGGMCNLAAGVGTKTIITGDFVHQLYGWNGVLKKIETPKLGPTYYFQNRNHVTLDPYNTDSDIIRHIIKEMYSDKNW